MLLLYSFRKRSNLLINYKKNNAAKSSINIVVLETIALKLKSLNIEFGNRNGFGIGGKNIKQR